MFQEPASFVNIDLAILRKFAQVTTLHARAGTRLQDIAKALSKHDLVFVWFGLGHASRAVLASRILRKPSVLVGGGWDVADMPEIEYGVARSVYGRTRASLTFGLASKVLAFSQWSAQAIREISPRAKVEPVYLGVDHEGWRPAPSKEPIALSIGTVSRSNLRRKGMETFARTSLLVPRARFMLVGRQEPDAAAHLISIGGPNFELTGELGDADLRELASRSAVYVQVSYTEGFGLAVAEAMSAGCVPVVTRAGALPEVVGECGFYVPEGDPDATAQAICEAMESSKGPLARRWISERFPLAARSSALRAVISGLVDGS